MLRSRDIVALLAALVLTRMAWNDSTESLQASANLAFYLPRDKAPVVSPMDVDGDGTNEALVVVQRSNDHWVWNILDLKGMHAAKGSSRPGFSTTGIPPFQPPVLFSAKDDPSFRSDTVQPIQIVTGQVLVKKPLAKSRPEKDFSAIKAGLEINDRNRHFFCGETWHDAAEKCTHPCPSGQSSDCPENQQCYADTPCNIEEQKSREETQVMFELTPGGGLPSIATLWSDGVLALSSLTKNADQAAPKASLELKSMWHVQLLPEASHPQNILWIESNVIFLDAFDSMDANGANHGMVLVSGSYVDEGLPKTAAATTTTTTDQETSSDEASADSEDSLGQRTIISFLIAVDAMHGNILWDTFSDEQKHKEPVPLPLLARGATSYARRRSRVPALNQDGSAMHHQEMLPNCQVTFRHHLRHILPYAHWTTKDSDLIALHLDQSTKAQSPQKKKHKHEKEVSKGNDISHAVPKKKWHHHFHMKAKPTGRAIKGRPNVLVTKSRGGMHIRSLRNGRPMCHMSLLQETLYADLNNDGTVDQVQLLLPNKKVNHADKWIRGLITSIQKDKEEAATAAKAKSNKIMANWGNNLCHALVLSGLPAREELFSTSLCASAHESVAVRPVMDLDAVAPIVVESLSGRLNTRDIIVGMNNGMIHRIQGRSGHKEWSMVGLHYENFPTWEESTSSNAMLTRVQAAHIPSPLRPILLIGENSLAVLSVKNGNILALSPFPQTSTSRPFLAELSGDGTSDVIVMSMDGIWGFKIQVLAGRPLALRLIVGLLLFSLMLAILRNRFGQRKDIRATDLQ